MVITPLHRIPDFLHLGLFTLYGKLVTGTLIGQNRMMRTYTFDDRILSPGRFRFHVLRPLRVSNHLDALIRRQRGKCPLCKGKRGPLDRGRTDNFRPVVDHMRTIRSFAYDLTIPLTKAYQQCHALTNLRAVHHKCNSARNRHSSI